MTTGSNTCYCCPDPLQTPEEWRGSKPKPISSSNVLFTPATFGLNRINKTETCSEYLKTNSGISDDVTSDFCASGKCIQAMVVMKMSFEYPSICRARKFPPWKNQVEWTFKLYLNIIVPLYVFHTTSPVCICLLLNILLTKSLFIFS